VTKNELTTRNYSWKDTLCIENKVYFLNENNCTSNEFEVKDSSLAIIAKGKILENGLLLESRSYEQGPFVRYYYNYVKE